MEHTQPTNQAKIAHLTREPIPIDIDALLDAVAKALPVSHVKVAILDDYYEHFAQWFDGTIHPTDSADESQQAVLTQQSVIVSPSKWVKETPNRRFFAGVPLVVDHTAIGLIYAEDKYAEDKYAEDEHAEDEKACQLSSADLAPLVALGESLSSYLSLLKQQLDLQEEHQLIENSPAVIMQWQISGGLSLHYASNNLEQIFGLPVEQLRQHKAIFEDYIDPKSLNNFAFLMSVHRDGVQNADAQFELRNPQGETFWVKMISKAFFEQGHLDAVHALLIDYTAKRFMEQKLREANQQMRILLEASDLATWDYDVANDHLSVNQYCYDMLGIEPDLFGSSRHFWHSLIHPADRTKMDQAFHQHISGKETAMLTTYRIKHANGEWVWLESYGKIVQRDAKHNALRVAGTHRNITQKKKIELLQEKQHQLLSFINKAMSAYLQDHDLSNACRKVLPELTEIADSEFAFIGQMRMKDGKEALFIHATSELAWNNQAQVLLELYHQRQLYFTNLDNLFGSVIRTESIVISNEPSTHGAAKGTPKGHPKIFRFMGLPIKLQGKVVGMIGFANKLDNYSEQDAAFLSPLTDALAGLYYSVEMEEARNQAEAQLKRMAMSDPLTGLYNRRALEEHFAQHDAVNSSYALAILDVDHFKQINDQHGHMVGDQVLKAIASRLGNQVRSDDLIARIGGEEFAIVIHSDNQQVLHERLNEMRLSLANDEIVCEQLVLNVTVSIGAHFVVKGSQSTWEEQIKAADQALYKAKGLGRNRVVWSA